MAIPVEARTLEALKQLGDVPALECFSNVVHGSTIIGIYPDQTLTVGRQPDGDENNTAFTIPDSQVSKRHFRIYTIVYEKGKDEVLPLVYCEDLESTNGTYVNGVLIGQISHERIAYILTDGDIIEIPPSIKFRFHQPSRQTAILTPKKEHQIREMQQFEDHFKVTDRVLGTGQYGAAYVAEEVATSKQVVCKMIDINNATRSLLREAQSSRSWCVHPTNEMPDIKREIKILAKLSHPHILNLRKAFFSDKTIYVITDLAPAGDLFSYVDSYNGVLVDWHARVIALQVLLALEYLHGMGIMHRDVKPENILITQRDFGGRVVLADFGFANFVNQESGRLASQLGTRGFCAPEVDRSPEGYSCAADLWSFGVTTVFMLTGRAGIPFEDILSQEQIVDRFCSPHSQWEGLTPRADKFLRHILTMDPLSRMSATEALEHSWFEKPRSEAYELAKGYRRIIKHWKRRNHDEDVIVALKSSNPQPVLFSNRAELPAERPRKRLPDATNSPYFGLDRRLQVPKIPSQKLKMIERLNMSSSPFVKDPQLRTPTRRASRPLRPSPFNISSQSSSRQFLPSSSTLSHASSVRVVDGKDMFTKNTVDLSTDETQDETQDEHAEPVDMIKTLSSIKNGRESFDATKSFSARDDDLEECLRYSHKRIRTDSEDGRIQEAAVKQLPKYTTAKALREMREKCIGEVTK